MSEQDKKQWRSLEERTSGPKAPERFNPFNNDFLSRREFMEWTSGMVAVLGASACTRMPQQKIVPYVKSPEQMIPGKPMFFATSMALNGRAIGLLVESHMGRPTKVEGNPDHPASLGTTDAYAQASVLDIYDPDRSQSLSSQGNLAFWAGYAANLSNIAASHAAKKGEGMRILTQPVISPTLAAQIQDFLKKYPSAQWHQFEPVHRDTERQGAILAFGEDVATIYAFDKAKVVVALDSDFMTEPATPRYAHDFANARRLTGGRKEMNRLYAVEPTPSVTGGSADHKIVARASDIEFIAAALAQECGVSVSGKVELSPVHQAWVKAAAADLKANGGAGVVAAGLWQSPLVHALAHAINARLGNVGKTVRYTAPVMVNSVAQNDSIKSLALDMRSGKVDTLIILGGNPAYNAPTDLEFVAAMEKVKNRIHCGLYVDETGSRCNYHIPEAHYLEQWSDAKAFDGTVGIVQPLIAPLYNGKSHHEVLAALMGDTTSTGYDIVRAYWKGKASGDFEVWWKKALNQGFIAGSAAADKRVAVKGSDWAKVGRPASAQAIEVIFRPDPTIFDGRFANNGWLQELPKPMTKVVWDNAAYVAPAAAGRLGLKSEHMARIVWGEKAVDAATWITPGQADNTVTMNFGYGRTHAGKLGTGIGFNAFPFRLSGSTWHYQGVEVQKTDRYYKIACTQNHGSMEGRAIVRTATLETHKHHPHWAQIHMHGPKALEGKDVGTAGGPIAPVGPADHQWGMAIDLTTCNGCNACVVACQAENNIPVVGKIEASRGREMQWLRIDRYYEGDPENPKTLQQPVACVHCETAPCEIVCPVGATVHDNEGLNNMVYNRCVGTKYCSNNCPYKVRHFNFYEYTNTITPTTKMVQNPDVTVRSRGVMEKCTYCVQRISEARITAKNENRKIRDGEVVTACQAACPTKSITFGDISDAGSLVSKLKAAEQNYSLLGELNTKPRTTYLGKVTNPNPALESEKPA